LGLDAESLETFDTRGTGDGKAEALTDVGHANMAYT
jgi:hypothetical protein